MIPQTTPAVNAGLSYMMGFKLTFIDEETIGVSAGQCRDVYNVNDIYMPTPSFSLSTLKNGVWGIDTGTIDNNKVYYVYTITDTFKRNPTAAIASLSPVAPVLPVGYDTYRRIGSFLTDGSAEILPFYQDGGENSTQRHMMFDDGIQVLTVGQADAWAPITLQDFVPNGEFMAHLIVELVPVAANDLLHLRRSGSVSVAGSHQISGTVAAKLQREYMYLPVFESAFDYFITDAAGSANIWLVGYLDSL
jgi:hypothetical protein